MAWFAVPRGQTKHYEGDIDQRESHSWDLKKKHLREGGKGEEALCGLHACHISDGDEMIPPCVKPQAMQVATRRTLGRHAQTHRWH